MWIVNEPVHFALVHPGKACTSDGWPSQVMTTTSEEGGGREGQLGEDNKYPDKIINKWR